LQGRWASLPAPLLGLCCALLDASSIARAVELTCVAWSAACANDASGAWNRPLAALIARYDDGTHPAGASWADSERWRFDRFASLVEEHRGRGATGGRLLTAWENPVVVAPQWIDPRHATDWPALSPRQRHLRLRAFVDRVLARIRREPTAKESTHMRLLALDEYEMMCDEGYGDNAGSNDKFFAGIHPYLLDMCVRDFEEQGMGGEHTRIVVVRGWTDVFLEGSDSQCFIDSVVYS
jgi:hypothetical protein